MLVTVRVEKELPAGCKYALRFCHSLLGVGEGRTGEHLAADDEIEGIIVLRQLGEISQAQVALQVCIGEALPGKFDGARAAIHTGYAVAHAQRTTGCYPPRYWSPGYLFQSAACFGRSFS